MHSRIFLLLASVVAGLLLPKDEGRDMDVYREEFMKEVDLDMDGQISAEELIEVVGREIGEELEEHKEAIQKVFEIADVDGSALLDIEELMTWLEEMAGDDDDL
mmetsp:Transcript_6350/g.17774  ORF Transcript_6350/g.17774 Transcript_6350/m.17774 type:complete len:104 (+) Transcript_6350:28-339(+)